MCWVELWNHAKSNSRDDDEPEVFIQPAVQNLRQVQAICLRSLSAFSGKPFQAIDNLRDW